jgi:hypothetical protein
MSHLLSRRAFSAGLAFGIPAVLLGKTAASQSYLDPAGTAMDLESVFLRVSPYNVRDRLIAAEFGEGYQASRWQQISQTPYFTSVGGVLITHLATGAAFGAYGVYLAPAGARAGQYLGRRALETTTTEVQAQEVGGYAAEVVLYDEAGAARSLTQAAVGNVVVLGYDLGEDGQASTDAGQSVANAGLLISHLREVFEAVR